MAVMRRRGAPRAMVVRELVLVLVLVLLVVAQTAAKFIRRRMR